MSVQTDVQTDNRFYMAGTEGTGEYVVVAVSDAGRVGFRELWNGQVRVRIEPSPKAEALFDDFFLPEKGWKQPDFSQYRYSTVVLSSMSTKTVNQAVKVLERISKLEDAEVVYALSFAKTTASRRRRALVLSALITAAAIAVVINGLRRKA